jgi:hypothetical protein
MSPRPSPAVASDLPVPLRDHCNGVPVAGSEIVDEIYNTVVLDTFILKKRFQQLASTHKEQTA